MSMVCPGFRTVELQLKVQQAEQSQRQCAPSMERCDLGWYWRWRPDVAVRLSTNDPCGCLVPLAVRELAWMSPASQPSRTLVSKRKHRGPIGSPWHDESRRLTAHSCRVPRGESVPHFEVETLDLILRCCGNPATSSPSTCQLLDAIASNPASLRDRRRTPPCFDMTGKISGPGYSSLPSINCIREQALHVARRPQPLSTGSIGSYDDAA